uniref:Isoform 2 of Protein SHORT HYPOCOTYL IN WHITE LIGHT 1 n=1 Tax=Arabidopsis thaliana TaxID=3702 RepID=F4I3V6-2|nr:hypothetical protein [Arabidopsis thaliana]
MAAATTTLSSSSSSPSLTLINASHRFVSVTPFSSNSIFLRRRFRRLNRSLASSSSHVRSDYLLLIELCNPNPNPNLLNLFILSRVGDTNQTIDSSAVVTITMLFPMTTDLATMMMKKTKEKAVSIF